MSTSVPGSSPGKRFLIFSHFYIAAAMGRQWGLLPRPSAFFCDVSGVVPHFNGAHNKENHKNDIKQKNRKT